MKKILLVTASMIALSATAASAADLAARPYTKAPPPIVSAVYDWTGFYIGINGGWGQSHDNRSVDGIGSAGSYDSSHQLMTFSGNYRQGSFWLDGDATLGTAQIDTHRNVDLGSVKRVESGNARAVHHAVRLNAGYRLQLGNLRTGPMLGIHIQNGEIGAFTEDNKQSTSMYFGSQKLDSSVLHAGWEAQATLGTVSPYVSISMKQEQKDDARVLRSGVYGTVGEFSVTGSKPDRQWTEWQAGATASLAKGWNAFVQVTGTSGRQGGNGTRYNLGLASTF